ncbi:flagellar hook-basal body complex protein FliE [Orenia metallireducens]|uniref:Flagellar hook-basal body complex protein FliE n=2 Tax=Orenia TaxID=46468 RepID=A0A285IFI0_9FIRM|nr:MULTISPECIES: flagellar hook-basal body complex protein FliE [Orenia]PRX20165.1 flagellar hook-basal body complex protein FliE [Orenia metallireducens]TDX48880.1 flagellar hook-basal body complex protein FliE [Orenia marismortui]SNY45836.1 flagellar hook-basal body complex protein FliE [Orenia metallireducens]
MKVDILNLSSKLEVSPTSQTKNYPTFSQSLKNSLAKVNHLQHQSNQADIDLALGRAENIHNVMIAAAKAKISLELTTAITTRCIDAYQEIMSMQI